MKPDKTQSESRAVTVAAISETAVPTMWTRYGTAPVGSNKPIWGEMSETRQPVPEGATHYQEQFAPLDEAKTYVRKRQFREAPGELWTSEPRTGNAIAGAQPGMEFSANCVVADMIYLSSYFELTE